MDITTAELKCLLRLLEFEGYRATLEQLRSRAQAKTAPSDCLYLHLHQLGLIDFSQEITQFGLTAAGRTLFKLDSSTLPVTPDERWILQACRSGRITPAKIPTRVPVGSRQRLLQSLAQRGLLQIYRSQIASIWLTPEGRQYLYYDYRPQGSHPAISLSLLTNYLNFMCQSGANGGAIAPFLATGRPITAGDVMTAIAELDQRYSTDNYLPIFYLREQLQPPLSETELNRLLFQLQRQNQIELSSLQDVTAYSQKQLAAGIAQDVGGALFFISRL